MPVNSESMTDQTYKTSAFSELGLAPPLMRGLGELGFQQCTPIQARALPLALQGRDVAGQAQTGTGKTAAFLLAIMHRLLTVAAPEAKRPNQPRALVLAPTRELAIQIHADAADLGKYTDLKLGLAYGGTGYESQRQVIEEGVDLMIGTPGRLIDYLKQKALDLRAVEVVVLDEADRMFDLGFIKDIRFLLRRMPPAVERLSMLFSATLSYRVLELSYEHMNNPETIVIEQDRVTAEGVSQRLLHVSNAEKISVLIGLLRALGTQVRVMVFVNTKREGERVAAYLIGNGFQAEWISGDVPQKKRQRLLRAFHEGEISVLVATDVAARGLHIPDVTHVINYDLPQDAEDYVHRIGRTARAGATGDAISLCCETYCYSLPEIEEYVGQKISADVADEALKVSPAPPAKQWQSRLRSSNRGQAQKGRPHESRRRRSRPRAARSSDSESPT